MNKNLKAIYKLTELIGQREAAEVIRLANRQERLEAKWRKRMKDEIKKITKEILNNAAKTGRIALAEVDFSGVVMEQSFDVLSQGLKSSRARPTVRSVRLASPPKGQIPRSFKALREMWDEWKKKKVMPKRQKAIADKLKKAYLEKVQSVWEKYGDEFRSGKTAFVDRAINKIEQGADVVYSRAKMIVETETTYYYNRARRDVYDESDDVTHYLFVAIRDHATTKWCKTRQGLVYKKGDPLLDKETPPCHWNCRSEILPLTPHNPTHLALIEDKRRARRNNTCEPLPSGWTAR